MGMACVPTDALCSMLCMCASHSAVFVDVMFF